MLTNWSAIQKRQKLCLIAFLFAFVLLSCAVSPASPFQKDLSATERAILSCARLSFPADKPVEQRSFYTTGFLVHDDKTENVYLISALHCFELCKEETICLDIAQLAAETHSKIDGSGLRIKIRNGEKQPLWIRTNPKEDVAYLTLDSKTTSLLKKEQLLSMSELAGSSFNKTVEVHQVLVPCYPLGATANGTRMPIVRRGTLTIYSKSCAEDDALKMQLDYPSFLGTSGAPVFEPDSADKKVRVLGIVTTLLVGDKTAPPTDLRLADVISVDALIKALAAK